jgi:CzcA family heavy metal efflux pump
MNLTDLAIRKSMTAVVLMIIVTIIGAFTYAVLPRESSPDVKIPFVMVYAPYYGTSPEDMENLVTRKIQTQLKSVEDLEEMTSTSSEGVSTVVLEFKPSVDMSDALQKVRDSVELAKPELPQDVRDDILIYELSASDWPIMQVVLSGPFDLGELRKVGEDLQELIEEVPGVLGVDLTGGVEREVRVDVDPERLEHYDLGLQDVKDAIALENVTLPGGEIALGTYEYAVRVPGEFESVEVIPDLVLNPAVDPPVYMRDVATVTFGFRDRDSISRKEGRESVTLSVKKRSGENIIEIADAVRELLDEQLALLPSGTEMTVMVDQSTDIRDMVTELQNNILSGLILVVVVLFLFLGFTNSLFVGIAIPFAMLLSFIVIGALGMTLNMVVLFSLILALGMLVDNAVVIVENIYRHRTDGAGPDEAASRGTRQVATAVTASTLTTICAFGPMVFWPGIMGEFMKYLPLTLIITLASSLLVALVFNPVLCANLMRVPDKSKQGKRFGARLMNLGLRSYEPVLNWALKHRAVTLGGVVVLLVVMVMLYGAFSAGVELFPDIDPRIAFVQVEAPSGTRVEQSDSYARTVEQAIDEIPDLKVYVTEVGASGDATFGGTGDAPPHLTRLTMEFVSHELRKNSSRDMLERLRNMLSGFTGAELTIDKQEEGPPTGPPVNIEIVGEDFETLGEIGAQVKQRIESIPGLVNLADDFDRGLPQLVVRPDLDKAARMGLRTMDLASTILTAVKGDDVGKYRVGEDEYDIVVRYARPARGSAEDLQNVTVFYEGENIPLLSFASVEFDTGLASINRIDGKRVVTVSGDVATGFNGNAVLAEAQQRLAGFELPPGYRFEYTGESEDQEEASAFLSKAFVVAIMLIFVVLVTQFDSVMIPGVILFTVILSLIGVFLGLLVTHTPFGIIMTGVGVISLAGIVVNNAIVLLDYIQQLRASGMEEYEAIRTAGRIRFRPVVLTAITTILGLIPLTTGVAVNFDQIVTGHWGRVVTIGGESSQWWGPMGVAVIWGLAVATFLTLVVVPVMYSVIGTQRRFFRRLLGRESAPTSAPAEAR